jgi:hypothetical protein
MSAVTGLLPEWIQTGWSFDHAGQQSCFVERQVFRLFAEVVTAGTVEPHNITPAKLDLVEIGGKKFFFSDRLVKGSGVPELSAFALKAAERVTPPQIVEYQVFEELHRDCAPTSREAALENRQQRDNIHAAVIEVALVLSRHDGFLHHLGDLCR